MEIDIGLSEKNRDAMVESLQVLLADTYALYLKTQNYHWNVTGPNFRGLHEAFEEQYKQLAERADDLAERIRSLGFRAPGSFQEFLELSGIEECPPRQTPESVEMVRDLAAGHELIAREIRRIVGGASDIGDEGSVDLLGSMLEEREETAWMLRSMVMTAQEVHVADQRPAGRGERKTA